MAASSYTGTGSVTEPLLDLAPVIFVTGKGGVGKTTVAAAMAVAIANVEGRARLVEFGDGESGTRALGASADRVEHVVIEAEEALYQASAPMFGSKTLTRVALGNFAMKRFLRAAPAMRELAMLEVVRQLHADRPRDRIVVDMPATGHGTAWLRIPAQLRDLSGSGPFYEINARLARELIAPGRCSVVVVTLPEPLVLSETLELCDILGDQVGLPAAQLVVNRIPVDLPGRAVEDAQAILNSDHTEAVAAAKALIHAIEARHEARRKALEALSETLVRTNLVPILLPEAPSDPDVHVVAQLLRQGAAS